MSDITAQPAHGASNIPDSRGIRFFTSDPDFAALAMRHKLLPVDPLDVRTASDEGEVTAALVNGRSVTLDQALGLLAAGSAQ